MKPAVTVVGLGNMGTSIARAFLAAGHPTTVWNRTPARAVSLGEAGATVARSPADAVGRSGLTVMCLADHDGVRAVLDASGVGAALGGTTLVQLTNGTADDALWCERWATEHGVDLLTGTILSAPRTIGTNEVTLTYFGPEPLLARHRDTLRALSLVAHVSDRHDQCATFTAALECYTIVAMVAYVQGMALARSAGLTPAQYDTGVAACETAIQQFIGDAGSGVAAGEFSGDQASVEVFRETARLMHDSALGAGMRPELTAAVLAYYDAAATAGLSDKEWFAVVDTIAPTVGSAP